MHVAKHKNQITLDTKSDIGVLRDVIQYYLDNKDLGQTVTDKQAKGELLSLLSDLDVLQESGWDKNR